MKKVLGFIAASLLSAALLPACGGGKSTKASTSTQVSTSPTATYSGGISGSQPVIAVGEFNGSSAKLAFGITANTQQPTINVALTLPGNALATGTFNNTNTTSAVSTISQSSGAIPTVWLQSFGVSNTPDQGAFSLTITSIGEEIDSNGNRGW